MFGIPGQAANVLTQLSLCLIQPILPAERIAEKCNAEVSLMNFVANREADSQQCQRHHDDRRAGY